MNLVEYLIQEMAINSNARRSEIAARILRGEIETTVTVSCNSAARNTESLLRAAINGSYGGHKANPLSVSKYKSELVKLAAGKDADFDVLERISIEAIGEQKATETPKPLSRQQSQEIEIVAKLRELKYEPDNLPAQEKGKPWVKKEVRDALKMSQAVFNKAWGRLLKNGEIAVAK